MFGLSSPGMRHFMNDLINSRHHDSPPAAANDDAAPVTDCLELNSAIRDLLEVVAPLVGPGMPQLRECGARRLLEALIETARQGIADYSGEQKQAIRRARALLCYLSRD